MLRRADWSRWRFGLRLLPQLVAPSLAGFVLLVAPALQDNSLTPSDAFRLFPALMLLLVALGLSGLVLTASRVRARVGIRR